MSIHYCYSLCTDAGRCRSYVGYTVDPRRRLRQHNGEIKGGARRTRKGGGGWAFLFVIQVDSDLWDKHLALSLEWHLKGRRCCKRNDTGGALATRARSVRLLARALAMPKFRPFLADTVIWTRDGEDCDDVWIEMDALSEALSLPALASPCVLPLSFSGITRDSETQKC